MSSTRITLSTVVDTKGEHRPRHVFPFGAFKGRPYSSVDRSYLEWCSRQPWISEWDDVYAYLIEEGYIKPPPPAAPPVEVKVTAYEAKMMLRAWCRNEDDPIVKKGMTWVIDEGAP